MARERAIVVFAVTTGAAALGCVACRAFNIISDVDLPFLNGVWWYYYTPVPAAVVAATVAWIVILPSMRRIDRAHHGPE